MKYTRFRVRNFNIFIGHLLSTEFKIIVLEFIKYTAKIWLRELY